MALSGCRRISLLCVVKLPVSRLGWTTPLSHRAGRGPPKENAGLSFPAALLVHWLILKRKYAEKVIRRAECQMGRKAQIPCEMDGRDEIARVIREHEIHLFS